MTSPGYKDKRTRLILVAVVVCFLILVNGIFVILPIAKTIPVWYWVVIVLCGLMMRKYLRVYNAISYRFDDESITIKLPGRKTHTVHQEHIKRISKHPDLPRSTGFGVKTLPYGGSQLFTTSTKGLLEIIMKDGGSILISPKRYPDNLVSA